MSNVQSYKSQCYLHGAVMPITMGGSRLDWKRGWLSPEVAGNYSKQNTTEGFQMPTFDINYVLLGANASLCPLHYTILQTFLARSNDAYNDVSSIANPAYFNGADGWQFPYAKPGGFQIGGSKGQLVRMSASYAAYQPSGSSAPTFLTSNLGYTAFAGEPINFKDCSFYTGSGYSTALNGVVSWDLSFSNNLTPDMTMLTGPGQQKLPIDVNAGIPTANLTLVFNADAGNLGDQITPGSSFAVHIANSAVSATIICPYVNIATDHDRSNEAPRSLRTYSGECLGIGNSQNQYPVVITA